MPKFHPDYCLNCGYSLDGLPVAHRCPECGTAYDEHVEMWHSAMSASQRVSFVILQMFMAVVCISYAVLFAVDIAGGFGWVLALVVTCGWLAIALRIVRARQHGSFLWIEPRGVEFEDLTHNILVEWADLGEATTGGSRHRPIVQLAHAAGLVRATGVFRSREEVYEFLQKLEKARERYDGRRSARVEGL